MNNSDDITSWVGEIHVHSSNFKNLQNEIIERGNSVGDYRIFGFTALQISMFYNLYQIAHKWKNTRIIINGRTIKSSPNITKVFRCCYESVGWPKKQNELYKRKGQSEKQLKTIHYCYGYERTIHNIVGCQKIQSARDRIGGWMSPMFVRIDGSKYEIIIEDIKKEIWNEWDSLAYLCPFMAKDRLVYGLQILEEILPTMKDYWTIDKLGMLVPRPIEYYFDMDYDEERGSIFGCQHSLVYFMILSAILGLSLYETVRLIAIEHPSLGFTIGIGDFKNIKTYIKFETIEQLIQNHKLLLPSIRQLRLTE
jgi:hypothetical protein